MKSVILNLIVTASLTGLAFAQGQPKVSALVDLGGNGSPAVPVSGAPERVKPPLPYPPGAHQPGTAVTEFRSGEFESSINARKSFEKALASLKAKGVAVIDAEDGYKGYIITFVSPRLGRVTAFESRQYELSSDAEKTMNKLSAALEAGGAAVLERNLKYRSFRLQYLDTSGYEGYEGHEGQQRVVEFQSSEFTFSDNAKQSMDAAVRGLTAAGHTVVSAESQYRRYSVTFVAKRPVTVQHYASREFTFTDDLMDAMENAVKALERSGGVVLEQNRNTYSTFKLQFLAPAGHGGLANQQSLVEFQSSDFTFSDDRKEAMDKAVRSLTAAGHTVLVAERQQDHYNISFMAARPVALREFVSREYTFSDDRKEAMRRAAQGLESSGAAVAEQSTRGDRFVIKYFETRQHAHPFPHY